MRKLALIVIAGALVAAPVVGVAAPATAVAYKWKNCTIVNQRLPHGVGRNNAVDHTTGRPVTSFRHDTTLYKKAMGANKGLDRDKDGIACEKA